MRVPVLPKLLVDKLGEVAARRDGCAAGRVRCAFLSAPSATDKGGWLPLPLLCITPGGVEPEGFAPTTSLLDVPSGGGVFGTNAAALRLPSWPR
jgi:hypothetical protein